MEHPPGLSSFDKYSIILLAKENNEPAVRELLDIGVDPNLIDLDGYYTALHAACSTNSLGVFCCCLFPFLQVIDLLINRGCLL
jgi:ankyrin repeat protein